MPQAPLSNGPQVAQGSWQGGALSTNVADMSAIGRGISSLGNAAADIYRQERDKAEDQQLTQALGKARELQTSELYDLNEGIMLKQGSDLYSIASERLNGFRTKLNDIRSTLSSSRVKSQFDRASDTLWQEYNRQVQVRIGGEREKTANTTMTNYIDSESKGFGTSLSSEPEAAIPRSADGSYDFLAVDDVLYRMDLAISDRVENDPGGFPEGRNAATKTLSDKAAGKVLGAYLDIMLAKGQTDMAKQFLGRYGDRLPLDVKATAIKAVESGTIIDQAQRHTDEILQALPEGSTLTQQKEKANEAVAQRFKSDARMRDEVQRRVNQEFARREDVDSGAIRDTFKDYYERLSSGEKIDKLSKERLFHILDPQHQELLKKKAEELTTGKDKGKDLGKLYRYEIMAKSNDPVTREMFRTLDLTKQDLTPKEFEYVSKLQMDLQEANLSQAKDAEQKGVRTVHQIAEDTAKTFLTKPEDRYLFQMQLEEQVQLLQERSKRTATPKEVQEIANDLLLRKAEGILSRDKYIFQLTPEQLNAPDAKIAWDKIPETDKNRIRTQWQKEKGRTPEKDEIQRQYFNEMLKRRQTRGIKCQK